MLSPRANTTVLHVTQPVTEGVGGYVATLVRAQAERGHRVGLACPDGNELTAAARRAGVEVLPWEAKRLPGPWVLGETRRLRRAMDTFRPDVVHLHSSKAGMAGRLAIQGRVPTVFQPHAWSFEAAGGFRAPAERWERLAGPWTDALISVSEGERAIARSLGIVPSGHASLIPNPIDIDRFQSPAAVDSSPLREGLRLGSNPIVVCVGRLCRQKGQDLLLDAWPRVTGSVPGAWLVLVGDGPDADRLAARRTEGVLLLGSRTDVPALLTDADLVAMPSRWEGMSLSMLEALAAGKPVVISDVGGAAETVGRGAGAVVAVGDIDRLAVEIMRRLLDADLRAQEGERGRQIVASDHSLAANVTAVEQVYEQVLRRRVRRRHRPATHGAWR